MDNENDSNKNITYGSTSYQPKYERPAPSAKGNTGGGKIALLLVVCILFSSLCGGAAGYYMAYLSKSSEGEENPKEILYQAVIRELSVGDDEGDRALGVSGVSSLVADSVVEITTESISTSSFMRQYVTQGAGSGVIITESGLIVTNYHVISGATSITVTLHNGEEYPATVRGYDELNDVAVIAIEKTGLTPAILGNSAELSVGEQIVIIGNPLGELGGSVSTGIISALARDVYVEDTPMTLLQTDAAVNPGNSGGGMFNLYGELVGIVNAKSQGDDIDNIGFAIPIDSLKTVIEQLITYGYVQGRPYMGISMVDIDNAFAAIQYRVGELGVYILKVEEDSNANKAGVKSGDMIKKFNGNAISSSDEITALLTDMKAGDEVTLTLSRSSRLIDVSFVLEELIPKDIVR
ncbi:MAG: PDZ domain-containing protein [Eubacteriaceae bacterium]|nr:PDZ domain-containing protein [Eubacteriaceae bacterium]